MNDHCFHKKVHESGKKCNRNDYLDDYETNAGIDECAIGCSTKEGCEYFSHYSLVEDGGTWCNFYSACSVIEHEDDDYEFNGVWKLTCGK